MTLISELSNEDDDKKHQALFVSSSNEVINSDSTLTEKNNNYNYVAKCDVIYNKQYKLYNEIVRLGNNIQLLKVKKSNATKNKINEEIAKLVKLKTELANIEGPKKLTLTGNPKQGTRYYNPKEMAIRENVFKLIVSTFKHHGAETIETPSATELQNETNKEDSKFVFHMTDKGVELQSLRYDLTIPFARYVAMNKIDKIKRYHIGKVCRRNSNELLNCNSEFYLCDFDIAGNYDSMVADAECLQIVHKIISELDIGNFTIKVNHRKILDGIFTFCGIPEEKFKVIRSSVDKLNKTFWDDIRYEMVEEMGLSFEIVDRLGKYITMTGGAELLEKLEQDDYFINNMQASQGLQEIKLLFKHCELFGIDKYITLDLSLARGLDYYTGIVYEAVLFGSKIGDSDEHLSIGSVAGGGRYDNLVGMFDPDHHSVPCVGVSFGIERIFSLLDKKRNRKNSLVKGTDANVYVVTVDKNLVEERLRICSLLLDSDIKAEQCYKKNPKLLNQLQYCEENNIPLAVIIGQAELKRDVVRIRNVSSRQEWEVSRHDIIKSIKNKLETLTYCNV